jgi:hypothetical protein
MARVVAAFQTVPSEVLFGVYEAGRKAGRPSLVYCGDNESGKGVAAELIRDAGFEPVDAGPLRIARYTEPFALLVAQLAYEREGGRSWRTGSSGSGSRHDAGPRCFRDRCQRFGLAVEIAWGHHAPSQSQSPVLASTGDYDDAHDPLAWRVGHFDHGFRRHLRCRDLRSPRPWLPAGQRFAQATTPALHCARPWHTTRQAAPRPRPTSQGERGEPHRTETQRRSRRGDGQKRSGARLLLAMLLSSLCLCVCVVGPHFSSQRSLR